jgi:hypothetical protein
MRADLSRVLSQYFFKKYPVLFAARKAAAVALLCFDSVAAHVDDSKQSQIKGLNRF